ncbi:MAG: phosphoribosylaminoimidazole-succinocarboxamide synthase, partial [Frankiaceae bacterium]|nr:phosphoribosylaminoimidazole-succinocarboxamide synthase [Frankiaceae bacterium]
LTGLSLWWFEQLADQLPHHVLAAKIDDYPPALKDQADALRGRSMLCKRLTMVEVECVARGYLTGSGLKEYVETQSVCGVVLPAGLVDGSRLPEPIFTPTTKAPVGEHDLPMTFAEVVDKVGRELAGQLRDTTIAVYQRGVDLAAEAGIILADTKVELGHDGSGVLTLADEVLTPDSSRFWPAASYEAGRAQPSFDKQYVRDWLSASGWDKRPPAPELPADVVLQTRAKYVEAYERLTGRSFDDYLKES